MFDKLTYKIPILPDPVDETKYLMSSIEQLNGKKKMLRKSSSGSENTLSEGKGPF